MASQYHHLPENTIRILTLLPGKQLDPLEGKLEPLDLRSLASSNADDETTFDALSYEWGIGKACKELICHNSIIKITQSLHNCLIHLRDPDTPRKLWIDQVCIDQSSEQDKEKQLPLMTYIYQYANQVVIWLGLADDSTAAALDLIRRAAACLRNETGHKMPFYHADSIAESFDNERNVRRGFPSIEDSEEWRPLTNFFAAGWFSRCWVVQESQLASEATIRIGDHSVDWDDLCVATAFFSRKSYATREREIFKDFHQANMICRNSKIAGELQRWEPQPLMHLLDATINAKVSEPKDKIYALLGMTDEQTRNSFFPKENMPQKHFFPGYSKTTMKELCTYTSKILLEENVNGYGYPLQALTVVKHYPIDEMEREARKTIDGGFTPSWVQRWHEGVSPFTRMYVMSRLPHANHFCAGGSERLPLLFNPQTPDEVSLHGFFLDNILRANHIMQPLPLPRSRLWEFYLAIRSVREDRSPYRTGESIDEAFALTVTVSDSPEDGPQGETYHGIDFQHFGASLYEQSRDTLQAEGRLDDIVRLDEEWGTEYRRLKALIGDHKKHPRFASDLQRACFQRKLFLTSDGYLGVGDLTLEPGDSICVFLSGRTPFIVRKVGEKYSFVGECYVHGVMRGEALEDGLKRRELITLV